MWISTLYCKVLISRATVVSGVHKPVTGSSLAGDLARESSSLSGSGTASMRATGMALSSDVQAVSLNKERSARDLVSGATSSTAQLLPSRSSTTEMSHPCGGMPSRISQTRERKGTSSACACRFHGRQLNGALATSTGGL
jgi:hypothetical protein